MITLIVTNLHWITPGDVPCDLCAHGRVDLIIDGNPVIASTEKDSWCVSAASLHLLRTLTASHTPPHKRVAEALIPCCGHAMYPVGGADEVEIVGCNSYIDWGVEHVSNSVRLTFADGVTANIPFEEWREAVCGFSDAVESFYERSLEKTPSDEDKEGYATFRREWARRRQAASTISH